MRTDGRVWERPIPSGVQLDRVESLVRVSRVYIPSRNFVLVLAFCCKRLEARGIDGQTALLAAARQQHWMALHGAYIAVFKNSKSH